MTPEEKRICSLHAEIDKLTKIDEFNKAAQDVKTTSRIFMKMRI